MSNIWRCKDQQHCSRTTSGLGLASWVPLAAGGRAGEVRITTWRERTGVYVQRERPNGVVGAEGGIVGGGAGRCITARWMRLGQSDAMCKWLCLGDQPEQSWGQYAVV